MGNKTVLEKNSLLSYHEKNKWYQNKKGGNKKDRVPDDFFKFLRV